MKANNTSEDGVFFLVTGCLIEMVGKGIELIQRGFHQNTFLPIEIKHGNWALKFRASLKTFTFRTSTRSFLCR